MDKRKAVIGSLIIVLFIGLKIAPNDFKLPDESSETDSGIGSSSISSSLETAIKKEEKPELVNESFEDISNYVNENRINTDEVIYDFENNPLSDGEKANTKEIKGTQLYNLDETKTIVIDNIEEYEDIKLDGIEQYELKLSPLKNKVYIDYLNTDEKGIITIDKDNSTIVYSIKDAEIISLSRGDGEYVIKFYVTKNGYTCRYLGKHIVQGENTLDETGYEGQNYYSNYSESDDDFKEIVQEIWNSSNSIRDYIWNCYMYTAQYEYDYDKSKDITSGNVMRYRPDVEEIISKQSGICLDKASVMASLLRAKGIPAKVVFGYYREMYHSWVELLYNDEWKLFDPTLKMVYNSEGIENYMVTRYN